MRIVKVLPVNGVKVLDNATDLDIGKRKGLSAKTDPPPFCQRFIEDFSVKIDDCAVLLDGAGMNVPDIFALSVERQLHVAIFAAFLRQDLDPQIIRLVSSFSPAVIPVNLAEKKNRGCTWRLRLARHFEFIGRNRLESIHGPCCNCSSDCQPK